MLSFKIESLDDWQSIIDEVDQHYQWDDAKTANVKKLVNLAKGRVVDSEPVFFQIVCDGERVVNIDFGMSTYESPKRVVTINNTIPNTDELPCNIGVTGGPNVVVGSPEDVFYQLRRNEDMLHNLHRSIRIVKERPSLFTRFMRLVAAYPKSSLVIYLIFLYLVYKFFKR